ncbi:MAG: O-antigen ligase family protein [Caulobacteraceae bacterium]
MGRPAGTSWPRAASAPAPSVRLAWIEGLLAAAAVVMFSDALIGPIFDPGQTGGEAVAWLRLVWLPVYAVVLGLALRRARELGRFWRPALALLVLVGWAALSVLWGIDPATTGRRALALAFTTLFGLYLAAAFDGPAFSEILAATFAALAASTLLVCVAAPGFGIHHHVNVGDWKGLWYEKNQMGGLMAEGALAALVAARLNPSRRGVWIAAAVLCGFLVAMSRSISAGLMLAVMLAALCVLRASRRGPASGVVAAWFWSAVGGLAAATAAFWPRAFYHAVGRDPTLTGRTDIWRAAEHWSAKAPWLGYGYGGFWGRDSSGAKYIRDQLGWLVPDAHSGWLDLRLALGWIGLILVAGVFCIAAVAALRRGARLGDGFWSMIFLAAFAIYAFSESVILQENSLFWALCAAALARLLGPAPEGRTRPRILNLAETPP